MLPISMSVSGTGPCISWKTRLKYINVYIYKKKTGNTTRDDGRIFGNANLVTDNLVIDNLVTDSWVTDNLVTDDLVTTIW